MDLEDLFSETVQVLEVFLPTDQSSGRPKGFAFVELADETSVITAIEQLNGHQLNGRSLRVSQAEDRPQRSPKARNHGPNSGYRASRSSKSKGSRRNLRARKRGG